MSKISQLTPAATPQAEDFVAIARASANFKMDLNIFQTKTAAESELSNAVALLQPLTGKNEANGYAGLDADGKIVGSALPAVTITETFVVNSEVEMLGLEASIGEVAVRPDINKTFILRFADATDIDSWQEILAPTGAVTSVAGRSGAVSLATVDISGMTAYTRSLLEGVDAATVRSALGLGSSSVLNSTAFALASHTHTFASITSKPTTLAGYGITNAYTKAEVDTLIEIGGGGGGGGGGLPPVDGLVVNYVGTVVPTPASHVLLTIDPSAVAAGISDNDHDGYIRMTTAASSTGAYGAMYAYQGRGLWIHAPRKYIARARVRTVLQAGANRIAWLFGFFKFHGSASRPLCKPSIGIDFSVSETNWIITWRSDTTGNLESIITDVPIVTDQWLNLRLETRVDSTIIDLYINDVLVGSPNNTEAEAGFSVGFFMWRQAGNGAQKIFDVDNWSLERVA
jgi:hypothetical protein